MLMLYPNIVTDGYSIIRVTLSLDILHCHAVFENYVTIIIHNVIAILYGDCKVFSESVAMQRCLLLQQCDSSLHTPHRAASLFLSRFSSVSLSHKHTWILCWCM